MRIIILGPPGSGKGTQAKLASAARQVPHISTGGLLRTAVRNRSDQGKKAETILKNGELVPDELVQSLLHERMQLHDTEKGFIIEGFPRNLEQASSFEKLMSGRRQAIQKVFLFELDDEHVVERLAGRRVCPHGHGEWHVRFLPPFVTGSCNVCYSLLIQRQDDVEDKVVTKMSLYNKDTEKLRAFYQERELIHVINAQQPREEISKALDAALSELEVAGGEEAEV